MTSATSEAFDERIKSEFDGSGPDVTFECAGLEETVNQGIRHARKGSTIVVVGVFGDCPRIDLGLVQDSELRLLGTLMYQRKGYAEAIDCLAESGVITQPLLTVSFPFGEYLHAYRYIEENRDRVMKVMIDLDRPAEARP